MDDTQRLLLFMLVCAPARALIAYGVSRTPESRRHLVGAGLVLIGLGLIAKEAWRLAHKQETHLGFFGARVYWNSFVHGTLYLLAAAMLLRGARLAWAILLVDLVIGVGFVVNRHFFSSKSSSKSKNEETR
jgi:hypothetical protein